MDRVLTERGYLKAGDSVVFLAGQPVGRPGATNLMKPHGGKSRDRKLASLASWADSQGPYDLSPLFPRGVGLQAAAQIDRGAQ